MNKCVLFFAAICGSVFFSSCQKESAGNSDSVSNSSSFATTATGSQTGKNAPTIRPLYLGSLTDFLFVFTNGGVDANWQGATKGFAGNVAVNGNVASERTSGSVPFGGKLYTNAPDQGAWQSILNQNLTQSSGYVHQTGLITALSTDLDNALTAVAGLTPSVGFESRSAQSLNGLNFQDGIPEVIVINVTSGMQVSTPINITGDSRDQIIIRWDSDGDPSNGYQGLTKFQSGGAIIPHGGLNPSNFINAAGDIDASGGGSTPAAPYAQGPRFNDGAGNLVAGGQDFHGGGFFTGYWLTTGSPTDGSTHSLSNAVFVGGWYSTTSKFSMTSGTSGVHYSGAVQAN